ncbi:cystathionine beta-synthase-like [Schistocerca gregaria]|uniref:cystathionine beta-synthase-like n=1 Tax=Schistocerca gregaria TaxID=7010 RepID=UPI00211F0A2C|nr:cystathionine beta-synthase-like [Schistocerca gregaria]XP_049848214.1 cystathionine beta-synthase-like [Schistocerca gregaria]
MAEGIRDTVLDVIGNTPLVRINKITASEGVKCEILAKCEFFNAGGSLKDRIGKRMFEQAEKCGRIRPGNTIIEPTSGNTGIGLALCAAIKGYRMIITMPEKMSKEKVDLLRALGAEVVRTPTEAAWDAPESHISVAQKLNREIPNSHILDQYSNPDNPNVHYETTANEIFKQCNQRLDAVVIGAGTGGTITGVSKRLKQLCPDVLVIGVDPEGSILAHPDSLNGEVKSYKIEGIGYDFIPKVLDRSYVDKWYKTNDKDSFIMARRLIKEEGLLCGGSSGAVMHVAIEVAKKLSEDARVVAILPDSVRNYMSKFISNEWMAANGFCELKPSPSLASLPWDQKISDVYPSLRPVSICPSTTVDQILPMLARDKADPVLIVDADEKFLGLLTSENVTHAMLWQQVKLDDPAIKCALKTVLSVSFDEPVQELANKLGQEHFVLVTDGGKVKGTLTAADLLKWINKQIQ